MLLDLTSVESSLQKVIPIIFSFDNKEEKKRNENATFYNVHGSFLISQYIMKHDDLNESFFLIKNFL